MFYVSLDKDLNKDGTKDNMILKYKDSEFIAGIPLKNTTLISNSLFSKSKRPKISKNAYYVISKKDLNNDKVKDYVLAIFKKNGDLIVVIPINKEKLMKYKQEGGAAKINNENTEVHVKDKSDFFQYIKMGSGIKIGSMITEFAFETVKNVFSGD